MLITKIAILFLLFLMTLVPVAGCQEESSSSEDASGDSASASSGASSESRDDDASGSSKGGDNSDAVSFSNPNPGGEGLSLNSEANRAAADSDALNLITWTEPPTLSPGELTGAGTVGGGARLFDPQSPNEGAAFEVYYAGHDDPMVALLPDLGPMNLWQTDHTVAEMDWEMEGGKFSFRAYSPLFMDSDPSNLELRVYGYDADANPALLAISPIVE